ncbi:MAG TPA: retropepsin-like aspartic protease [Ignavibacteria bacterium]|nr:retropepsin-like aspartic protease [Ignavibacteria bacterium]HRJ84987.1 retropepsin-like aspartic protease [Ignavibacteria bacterium]
MKVLILVMTLFAANVFSQRGFEGMLKLHENKDFFRFIKSSAQQDLSEWQSKFINSLILNLQSKNAASNVLINELLQGNHREMNDSLKMLLYETRMKNSVHLCNYKDASVSSEFILNNYSALIDSSELADINNSLIIWKAAENLGQQVVTFSGDSKISTKRDLAGLINIPVKCSGHTEDFVFDTGANFSVVSSSYAKKLKMIMIGGSFEVGSITGKKITSRLAYAEMLEIGRIKISNALFLVMPDESLSFAGGLYVINGIIGLPVIQAMKELHLRKNEIYIPEKRNNSALTNLLIDGFIPVIEVINNNDSLAFTFDTGAKTTLLYSSYYDLNRSVIEKKYEPEEIEFGGAGGTIKLKGFVLGDLIFRVGTSVLKLDEVKLIAERIKDHDRSFVGNLGQDYMGEFSEMILNFEHMYVDFKK